MKKIFLLSLLLFLPFFAHAQAATTSPFGERIFYYSTLKSNVADFAAHASDIDIIAPQTYEVTYNLNASGTVPANLYQAAQTAHVKIMPLIANKDFNQALIHRLLASSTAQSTLVSFLVSEAQSKGYVGWQFDLEHIPSSDANAFSAFVAQAATALHARGLILSVAVVAQVPSSKSSNPTSSFYKNWSGAYDYAALASSTDFLSLMAYDDPDSTNASAPIPFVKSALAYALTQVPPSKISLGIPLFYWGWTTANPPVRLTSGGTYAAAMQRLAQYPSLSGFNASVGIPWIIYKIGKKVYMLWYENAQSFLQKTALISSYHLRGFSAWVLGAEDPGIWNAFVN